MIWSYLSKNAAFKIPTMTLLFHSQPRVYLMCYQICSRIAIMPLSGSVNSSGMKANSDTFQFMSSQVKYFIDRFKATGPYNRNNTNNCNKITNTTVYLNKTKPTWRLLNSSECQIYIFTQKPDGFTIAWA